MTVQHHLDDATLLRYASGDLDEAFAVVVASHLSMCTTCRRAARDAEEVGGRLLETVEEAAMPRGAFGALMKRLDGSEDAAAPQPPGAFVGCSEDSDVPLPLRRFIGASLDKVSWTRVAPGVRRHVIALTSPESSPLFMLRIEPGKAVPEHGHGGTELTLVLSGSYRDELGRFGPGDIADLDENVEHRPKVEPGEPCICLVTREAPTKYKGFISRLLQPVVGI